jgi:hypothetical protein
MEAFANTDVYKLSTRQETVQLPSDEQELQFMQYAMEQFEQANYLPWSFFTYTKMVAIAVNTLPAFGAAWSFTDLVSLPLVVWKIPSCKTPAI